MKLGGHGTKAVAVYAALEEYVWKRQAEAFLALEGTIDFRDDYDHKDERRKASHRVTTIEANQASECQSAMAKCGLEVWYGYESRD